MKLDEYRKKRNAARTNEPFGGKPLVAGPTVVGAYVVHLHDARRRHYDLRIEVGGALESFAVPRGPTLVPGDRRLAVRTEPHPIEYLDFEEIIPEGNYGAGPMIAWDRGRVRYIGAPAEEQLAAGKIDFELSGFKLHGRFALVRLKWKDKDWLFFKKADEFAAERGDITAELPRSVLSGLTVEELFSRDGSRARRPRGAPGGAGARDRAGHDPHALHPGKTGFWGFGAKGAVRRPEAPNVNQGAGRRSSRRGPPL
jgi:bifunctional non-homologous end joining protein LigD